MTKQISITISDYTYDQYLKDITFNRSAFIEEMLIKGVELTNNVYDETKAKVSQLVIQNKNFSDEIRNLKLQIENYKAKINVQLRKQFEKYNVDNEEDLEKAKAKEKEEKREEFKRWVCPVCKQKNLLEHDRCGGCQMKTREDTKTTYIYINE